MFIVGQHHRDRPLDMRQPRVGQRPGDTGGVHDVAVAEQHKRVDALVGHRGVQTRTDLSPHPGEVGLVGNVERGEARSGDLGDARLSGRTHRQSQEILDVRRHDLDGSLRPDRFHHGGQRLLRVPEGALVVRVVAGPHHVVDTDLIDQPEAQRIHHERGAHVMVPVVPDRVLQFVIEHVPVGGEHVLGVLQCGGHPGDPALEPPDLQARMPIQDSGEHVLGELLAERVDIDHHADYDAVVLARRLGRGLTDVMADRQAGGLDLVPHRVHLGAAVVVDVALVVLSRIQRQQERLEPQRFQLLEGAAGAGRVPTS